MNGYSTYDMRDGPHNHGYAPDYRRNPGDVYGTYPRHMDHRYVRHVCRAYPRHGDRMEVKRTGPQVR